MKMTYDVVYNLHPAYVRIFEIATRIEPDPTKLLRWFHEDAILELDNQTAKCLVDAGRAPALEAYLMRVLEDVRESSG
jgi:hypothetical protein